MALSSSLLWVLVTPQHFISNRTVAAFSLCCRGTLHLVQPNLKRRRRAWSKLYWICKFLLRLRSRGPPTAKQIRDRNYKVLRVAATHFKLNFMRWLVWMWPPTHADIHYKNFKVLHIAVRRGNLAMVKWLVEKYPPSPQEVYHDIPSQEIGWNSHWLLYCAVESGNTDLIYWVADKWPPTPNHIHFQRYRILNRACRSGNMEIAKWLVEKWPPTDAEVYDFGYHSLYCAACHGHLELVQWLVKRWPPFLGHFRYIHWSDYFSRYFGVQKLPVQQYLRQVKSQLEVEEAEE